MNNTNPLREYQKMQLQTSSPEKLVLILYDEAIKCLHQAKIKIEEKNIEESNRLLIKTQKIILELMCSLKLDIGEISKRLHSLYDYMYRRLIQANLEKNSHIVEEIILLLKPLKDAWIKAMEEVK